MKYFLLLSILTIFLNVSNAQNSIDWSTNYIGNAVIFETTFDNEGSSYYHGRLINRDSVDFEPGTGNHIYKNLLNSYFVTKHDSSGNFQWVIFLDYWMHMEFLGDKLLLSNATFGHISFTDAQGVRTVLGLGYYSPYATLLVDKFGILVTSVFYDTNAPLFIVYYNEKGVNNELLFSGVFQDTINFGFFHTIIGTNPWETHFIMRQDQFGLFKMARALDFGSAILDFPLKVSSDSEKNIFYAIEFSGEMDIDPGPDTNNISSSGPLNLMILKYDSMGNFVQHWHLKSRNGVVETINFDLQGNFLIAGELQDSLNLSFDSTEYWIHKSHNSESFIAYYNSSGDLQWHKKISGDASFRHCFLNDNGDIYLLGSFISSLNLDPGSSNYTINSNAFFASTPEDDFLVRYNDNGNFLGTLRLSAFEESIGNIAISPNNELYLFGWFYGSMSSPSTGLNSLNWQLSSHNSPFIIKLQQLRVGIDSDYELQKIKIFPNPGNGLFQVLMEEHSPPLKYKIVNLSGTVVQDGELAGSEHIINLTSMKEGLYIFIAEDGEMVYQEKLIKN